MKKGNNSVRIPSKNLLSIPMNTLCDQINSKISSLSYEFTETSVNQKLQINAYNPVFFVLGEDWTFSKLSSEWIRTRHRDGSIHEHGTISILDALCASTQSIQTVFDVGALYGYFSLISASIFDKANIYSFEMNPYSFAAMKENIILNNHLDNSRINAFNYALSDVSEMGKQVIVQGFFFQEASFSEKFKENYFSLVKNIKYKIKKILNLRHREPMNKNYKIDFWSIDDFCDTYKVTPDLIKIDVEGFQGKIIPGAMKTIAKSKPFLLLEFDWPGAKNSCGLSNKEIVKPLFDLGYQLIWGNHRKNDSIFQPLDYNDLDSSHECNSLGLFFFEERVTGL